MSTRKEQTRQEEEKQLASQELLHQREQQQSINRSLDETKNNIRRTVDEQGKISRVILRLLMSIKKKLFKQPGRWQITT